MNHKLIEMSRGSNGADTLFLWTLKKKMIAHGEPIMSQSLFQDMQPANLKVQSM